MSRQVQLRRHAVRSIMALVLIALVSTRSFASDADNLQALGAAFDAIAREESANGGTWPQLSQACVLCHGREGDSRNQLYPKLAGQPAPYLAAQLRAFASSQRANLYMTPIAASLSDEQVDSLATYFARQRPVAKATFTTVAVRVQRGAKQANAQCAACHGAHFEGSQQWPRLAGQGYDYLVAQLKAFRDGSRRDKDGVMAALAAPLSDEDIADLASYLASR